MRVLVIDDKSKEAIASVRKYAEENHIVITRDSLVVGIKIVGDDPRYVCYINDGFRVVFSIEDQPSGSYKHISISVDDDEKLPSISAFETIMREFGLIGTIMDGEMVNLEHNLDIPTWHGKSAVNFWQRI